MAESQGKGKKPTIAERKLANKEPKRPLTVAERQARNKRNAAIYQEERLRSAFKEARDHLPSKKRKSLIPWEEWEDPDAVAPTRRKVNRVEENVEKLAKKTSTSLMEKALKNLAK
mmetsp:Transcript_91269/g.142489  ORF Transcript_91269/g.142489 Transcript_91269/m.142489 type:complete len:115 (+) Transcript_91269:39-383(+)